MNVGLLSADHITIDKWHVRACLTKPIDGVTDTVETVTDKQYRRIEAITAQIAKVNGFKGFELQAIIWVAIKATWNR
jgi:thermostable 8-oxoguanine DNA glycosylase